MGGEEGCCCRLIQVPDESSEVIREAQEGEDEGEEAVVLGWEGPLEIDVVYVDIPPSSMGVFKDEL